jgi:hypothetical protein
MQLIHLSGITSGIKYYFQWINDQNITCIYVNKGAGKVGYIIRFTSTYSAGTQHRINGEITLKTKSTFQCVNDVV